MSERCELCKQNPVEIEFNCMLPGSDGNMYLVKADLCFDCIANYEDDGAVAIAVLEKRAGITGEEG